MEIRLSFEDIVEEYMPSLEVVKAALDGNCIRTCIFPLDTYPEKQVNSALIWIHDLNRKLNSRINDVDLIRLWYA